jgi:hypothetical protein
MAVYKYIILALLLSGCANMTPAQKTVAWTVAGVVVAGVAMSLDDSSPGDPCPTNHWHYTPEVGYWVCVR